MANISGGGILVLTCDPPPSGARVHLSVSFRSLLAGARLVVRSVAQVVRVESASEVEGHAGFAVAIESYTLRKEHKKRIDQTNAGAGSKTSDA